MPEAIKARIAQNRDFLTPLPTTSLYAAFQADRAFTDAGKTTLCSSSGSDTCYTLEDQSGNGRDLVQSTAASRPTWYSDQLNSRPCLRFDGSNDSMSITGLSQAQPISVYIVAKQITWTLSDRLLSLNNGASDNIIIQSASSPQLLIRATSVGISDTNTPAIGAPTLVMGVINGGSTFIKTNNNPDATGSPSGTTNLNAIGLCYSVDSGADYGNFDVFELLIYSAAHASNTGDGLSVRKYLSTKYNLGVA